MTNEDKRISELYTELYKNAVPSAEYKRKVRNMTENGKKATKITIKVFGAVAAAAVILTAGAAIAYASKGYTHQGVYDNIVVNGEEKKVKYGEYDNDIRFWSYDENGKNCSVFVYGPFDNENETLYVVDMGDYIIASTDPNPTLNLYDEIDNTPYAKIDEESGALSVKGNPAGHNNDLYFKTGFSFVEDDEKDGEKDGKLTDEDMTTIYAVLPNGAIVETNKGDVSIDEEDDDMNTNIWDTIWERMGSPEIETSDSE